MPPTTLATELPALAKASETRTYDSGQASIEMCLSFLGHIVATSTASGIDDRLPRLLRDVTIEQAARGPLGADWESVAEGLTRSPDR